MSEIDESRYMAAPDSGRLYEKSLNGFKQFFATELPRSLPAIFAIIGAITISLLVSIGWIFLSPETLGIPSFGLPALLTTVSIVWGYGGWIHGTKVQAAHERGDKSVEKII